MGGDTFLVVAVAVMAAVSVGGVAYVFALPWLSGERRTARRVEVAASGGRVQRVAAQPGRVTDAQKRRKQVEDSLKDLEAKRKAKNNPPLPVRIEQAGLKWSLRTYVIVSVVSAILAIVLGLVVGVPRVALLGLAAAGGLGFPRWLLSYLKNRRQKKFLEEFPNAVDVIVRGVKAGLPLNDCVRIVAHEAQEPVRTEFRTAIEAQTVGLSVAESLARMVERMPLPEVNFFVIVVTIQQKSGGNLAEALGNLSKVLRDRKKMKGKIQAMSQEAKASAAIIGALPLIVMLLVFLTSPDYISLLWTETLGHVMLAGSALWMLTGVIVMRKMINFDF